jgi:hypothetical protein
MEIALPELAYWQLRAVQAELLLARIKADRILAAATLSADQVIAATVTPLLPPGETPEAYTIDLAQRRLVPKTTPTEMTHPAVCP